MRIKRISILRYGPISDIDIRPKEGLQVIFGKNETGKTLTIDAMIKMMVGSSKKEFDCIDRVEESPEGFILFEDDQQGELKIDYNHPLIDSIDTSSLDLRNILIIRNSDLKLFEQDEYLKEITDRLTGMQTERIELLIKGLADHGRLTNPTSGAKLSRSQDHGKVELVRRDALELKHDAEGYLKLATDEGHDSLELKLLELKQRSSELEHTVDMAEKTRSFKDYQSNLRIIDDIKKDFEELKMLEGFDEDTKDQVDELSRSIDMQGENLAENKKQVEDLEGEIDKASKEYENIDGDFRNLDRKKEEIDDIKSTLKSLQPDRAAKSEPKKQRILVISAFILMAAGIVSLAVTLLQGLRGWLISLPIIFILVSAVFFLIYFYSGIGGRRLKSENLKIMDSLNLMGIKVTRPSQVYDAISSFEDDYQKSKDKRDKAGKDLEVKKASKKGIKDRVSGLEKDIRKKTSELKKLLGGLSVKDVEGFLDNFRKRQKIYNRISSNTSALGKNSYLDIGISQEDFTSGLPELLKDWQETLEENRPAEVDEDSLREFDLSKKELDNKKEKLKDLDIQIEGISKELKEHRNTLASFTNRFRMLRLEDFMAQDLDMEISSLERLEESIEIISLFVAKIDTEFNTAIEAISILEGIRSEEDLKIGDLFNDLKVSRYFVKISSGRYSSVYFDPERLVIRVVSKDGEELDASSLSKGAMDQLYLSVRLALSERIFSDKPGFFIFDDPLLASDSDRIKNQFGILRDFCKNGWSVLYFTVKDEIRDISSDFTSNKMIRI